MNILLTTVKTRLLLFCTSLLLLALPLRAQSVSLVPEPGFVEYVTYYISSFDVQTGASDFQLFRYRLHVTNPPASCSIRFKASMISPALGIDQSLIIVEMTANFVNPLENDVIIDNRDISSNTTYLMDVTGNMIPINVPPPTEMIDLTQFQALLSSVMTTGRLADGEYTFEVEVFSGPPGGELTSTDFETRTIIVQAPSFINLESPGGTLADTAMTEIYTTFPLFVWHPQFCDNCDAYIRVAEFKRNIHSSVEEAIEDETTLPFNQSLGWEHVGVVTSYNYPLSGARLLEPGKIYVWQVKATLPTTAGQEEILSPIYAFKIGQTGGSPSAPPTLHPVIQYLEQTLSSDQFQALFGPGGTLEGFAPTGQYTLDGTTADNPTVLNLLNQVMNQEKVIINLEVEE
jgi:hypothetical protein